MSEQNRPWYRELNSYHWFVFVVAALGWLFDTMDQQLFVLARRPACTELLGLSPTDPQIDEWGGWATAVFLVGWATGGIVFGMLGDRIGRARTMFWTILIYSAFTGLSALSTSVKTFAVYRFLTGLGVGGEFAVGVALVAEVMPDRCRPFALGLLQALSAIGNVSAALISMGLGKIEEYGYFGSLSIPGFGPVTAWRLMFVVGTVPALLAVLIRRRLKEPERWQATVAEGKSAKKLGSFRELFGNRRWGRNAMVGLVLAVSGQVGLWGIGFFSPDLNRKVFRRTFEQEARDRGDAVLDRQFVRLALGSAESLETAKAKVSPANLIGDAAHPRDAETIYAAALELHKAGRTVSRAEVLAALDRGDRAKGIEPQSAADRARRAEYLQADEADPATLGEHLQRIENRSVEISGRLTKWAGITSIMLNLGAFVGIYGFSLASHVLGRRPAFAVCFLLATGATALVFSLMQNVSDVLWMVPLMGFAQLSLFGGYAIYFPELFPTHLRSTGTSFCYNAGRLLAACGPFAFGQLNTYFARYSDEPMRDSGLAMCAVFLVGLLALPFAPETKGQPLPE